MAKPMNTNDRLKDKMSKGHFLSDDEKNYLQLDAHNAVAGIAERYRNRGAGFVLMMAEAFFDEAKRIANREAIKAGKQPVSKQREPETLEETEASDDSFSNFFSKR